MRLKEKRRAKASEDYNMACELASLQNMTLLKHSDSHYQLRFRGFLWNIYPGNLRVIRENPTPFIKLPENWDLIKLVAATILQTTPMEYNELQRYMKKAGIK